ncbi:MULTISPECIES: DUF3106 domain-containing protein [unclassified Roseateles]|uniref:DUF3106 domain-containing protein n=1 Tax=unclassified Roseateles TaxID=2626991 RepID=UPI0006F99EF5|nr:MULTISPECIES: DUF3106 domain-containing protein [unclassified Roseateles]KQW44790.1 hypothetical protein ASC81_14560 [Pelomonas sp. Root405]KRA70149.1 hypothetical protein ASD88_18720 [Pelomonas sp. Root662]
MIRAALTLPALCRLSMALLLNAAGFSAFAQPADAAVAPEPAASVAAAPSAAASKPRPLAKPVAPTALSAPPPAWSGLTAKQQALLAPLERDWAGIEDSQRSKWLSATPTLATMSGEEIKRVHDRMRDWTSLSASERANARIGFQVSRQLTAEQRQARWEAYQALPPEERQALAEKARARRQAQAARAPNKPIAALPKSNIVPAAPKLVAQVPVTGSLIQAKPGATTVLITRGLARPSHHAAGQSKVVADPALVDSKTLLPKSLKAPRSATPRP